MYRYIIVESKNSINEYASIIQDVFNEYIFIHDTIFDKNRLVFIFSEKEKVDFKDLILNINAEFLIDLRMYLSKHLAEEKILDDYKFTYEKLKFVNFGKYVFIDQQILLFDQLGSIDENYKKIILGKYYNNKEMLDTIKTFLEFNQNTSITAKKLYLHRNTLMQRIEKFITETGFDVRSFKDAYLIYTIIR